MFPSVLADDLASSTPMRTTFGGETEPRLGKPPVLPESRQPPRDLAAQTGIWLVHSAATTSEKEGPDVAGLQATRRACPLQSYDI